MRPRLAFALYWLLGAFIFVPQAHSQLLDQFLSPFVGGVADEPAVTVLSRQRSDYESAGIRAGSFLIRPRLAESGGYESNVLGTSKARGSALVETNGTVEAASDVSRVSLTGALTVDDVRYLDLARQSYTNWAARVGGSYDIGRDTASVQFSHDNLTQTLRDLDVPQLVEPLTYVVDTARFGYRAVFNRLSITPSVEVARYAYDSGLTGSAIYSQAYRNRVLLTPALTVAYEFAPRRSAVLVIRNTSAWYSHPPAGLPKRNYDDAAVLAGIDYDLSGLVRVRALVGYEIRTFSASSSYSSIEAPVAELTVIWTPTGLTTITGALARRVQDSAAETTSGVTETSARLRVDHELRRNVLLAASAGITQNDYQSGGDQTLYTAGVGATYLINRYAGLTGTYDFIARQSSSNSNLSFGGVAVGANYVDHRILLQLRFSL